MRNILIALTFILAMVVPNALFSCVAPVKPVPPIGCSYQDAVLVHDGQWCEWVYMSCGDPYGDDEEYEE